MENDEMTTLEFKSIMEMVVMIIESSKDKKRLLKNSRTSQY